MKVKILFLFTCSLFVVRFLSAQNGLSVVIPSPNAASLGLYGEIPVSYFTGVPDISIPLYEIKGNKIGLPISLSYHASGLRPDMHPSWVGNGWSLQAGGAITRKPNGQSDEFKTTNLGTQGYYYNHNNLLPATSWSASATLKNPNIAYGQILPPANPNGVLNPNPVKDVDVEPDEFDFNFMGYSGKFYLDPSGNWQVQSDKALKVVFNQSDFVQPFTQTAAAATGDGLDVADMSNTFGRFTIIDEHGNQYVFGSVDSYNTAIEFSDVMIPQIGLIGSSITATSWYLSQIISADGTEVINLNYMRGPFTSYVGYQYTAQQCTIPGSSQCQAQTINKGSGIFSGRVISPVYLTSITMPTQSLKIDFSNVSPSTELNYTYNGNPDNTYLKVYSDAVATPSQFDFPSFYTLITNSAVIPYFRSHTIPTNNWDRFIWLELNAITVTNTSTNALIRNINFTYNNNPLKRLQLQAVNLTDVNGNSIEQSKQNYYTFSYNQTSLPNYLTIFGDHWGFNNYNGSNNLAAGWNGSTYDFFTPHNPDPTGVQTQAEILTGITNPTGGTTTFTYEPNQYSTWVDRTTTSPLPVAQTGVAGGLRIKTITTTDQFNSSLVKNYFYVKGYTSKAVISSLTSSGVLDSKPQYTFATTGTTSDNRTFTNSFVSSNSVVPVSSNTMGSYIGYSYVIEQRSDASYTIYNFSNHDNGYGDQAAINSWNSSALRGFNTFSSFYFERGRLLDKKNYTNNDLLLLDEATQYTLTMPTNVINAVSDNYSHICSYGAIWANERVAYSNCYSPFVLTNKTSTLFSSDGSGNSTVTNTSLSYDSYKNVIQGTTVNSKGQSEQTTVSYPPNFVTSDVNNPYSMMFNMNNVSTPIEKRISIAGNLVSGELRTYQALGLNKIYNNALYNYEITNPVPASNLTATFFNIATGNLSFDNGYVQEAALNYDPSGNLSTVNKTGSDGTAYIWDYDQELPVANVSNANNIYSSTNNSTQTENLQIHVPFTLNTNITQNITLGTTGTVNLSFAYSNPTVSGSSQINWTLYGPTYAYGTLCTATATSTTHCSTYVSTAVVNNVLPGAYSLVYDLTSCLGFQNYYGYTLNVSYPASIYSVVNSKNDIALTSFEYNNSNDLLYGTGNWSGILLGNIRSGTAVTGNNYYLLTGSTLSKVSLNSAQTYIVSYWSNSGPYSVSGSISTITGANISAGNWTYYEHVVTNSSTVTITGTGNIDELRLYPKGSLMTSYTYIPLIGMTSKCDENNYITYYQYDSFNRLYLIKDRDNNILKEYQYNY